MLHAHLIPLIEITLFHAPQLNCFGTLLTTNLPQYKDLFLDFQFNSTDIFPHVSTTQFLLLIIYLCDKLRSQGVCILPLHCFQDFFFCFFSGSFKFPVDLSISLLQKIRQNFYIFCVESADLLEYIVILAILRHAFYCIGHTFQITQIFFDFFQ